MTMTTRSPHTVRRVACAIALLALAFACTEPQHTERSKPSPLPALDARIELSDSLADPGSEVVVTVRLVGTPVASTTARLLYDATGVELVREESIDDGATRVMNPQPGVIRFAGVAANGFAGGRVYSWRFVVHRTAAIRTLRLMVDEAHTVARADAAASLSRKP
ncbi:MAG: hypothetical protein ACM37U_04440 [Gemmatimonas sp.]|nr:hypothetical protein [Gemmatimonadaceae bacterium]